MSQAWLQENGPIESLSAFGYFVCASVMIFWFGRELTGRWYMPVLVTALGLRELDFHSRFTTMSISKLRFYTGSSVPLLEKLTVVVVAFVGWAAWLLLWKHGRTVLKDLRAGSFVVIGVVLAGMLAVFAKSIDGLARKLDGVGLSAPEWLLRAAHDSEEIMELGIPMMLLTALLFHIFTQAAARRQTIGAGAEDGR